jgi:hypothetical protein
MSFRRRHRWFRRLALGLAATLAVAAGNASYAFATIDEGTSDARYVTTPGWSGLVDAESGIPLSAGITKELRSQSPAVMGEEVASKAATGSSLLALSDSPVRPDDQAARFAHSDVAPQPEAASSTAWTFERGDVLILAIGSFAVVLALGLALGVVRRPRLAGC